MFIVSRYCRAVLIRHLALTVRDPARSRDFYLQVLGLDGEAHAEEWGFRVKMPDGFMLALIQGEPLPDGADALHFGCVLPTREDARELRERLRNADVPELEWEDEATYTGVKVRDPDGYIVELAFDAE